MLLSRIYLLENTGIAASTVDSLSTIIKVATLF